jgi:hypothetical protein
MVFILLICAVMLIIVMGFVFAGQASKKRDRDQTHTTLVNDEKLYDEGRRS